MGSHVVKVAVDSSTVAGSGFEVFLTRPAIVFSDVACKKVLQYKISDTSAPVF